MWCHKKLIRSMFAVCALMLSHERAGAVDVSVDVKNGNLNIGVADIELTAVGYNLRVRRTYNSRSHINGLFGNRWCSELETKLVPDPVGGYVRVECGAGVSVPFTKKGQDPALILNVVSQILAQDPDAAKLESQLLRQPILRNEFATRMNIGSALDNGTVLFERGRGPGRIVVEKNQIVYESGDDFETFDRSGRLLQHRDRHGNVYNVQYENGRASRVSISPPSREIKLSYNADGRIAAISSNGTELASYSYDRNGNLTGAKSTALAWTYKYTQDGRLTSMENSKGAKWKTLINEVNGWTERLVDEKGCSQTFIYPSKAGLDYQIRVDKTGCSSNDVAYSLSYRDVDMGTNRVLAKSSVLSDSENAEVEYHLIFQKPSTVNTPDGTLRFSFDSQGRVVRKEDSHGSAVAVEYDPICEKISHLTQAEKEYFFTYDTNNCDLLAARDSDDEDIKLHYDGAGRISIIEGSKNVFIEYESKFGKPSKVTINELGSIDVVYNDRAEIESVDSDAGPGVAVQVASQFNTLLDLVSVAQGIGDADQYSLLGQSCGCSSDAALFDWN